VRNALTVRSRRYSVTPARIGSGRQGAASLHLALGFFGFVLELLTAALDIASEAGHRVAAGKRDSQQNESNDAFQHRHLLHVAVVLARTHVRCSAATSRNHVLEVIQSSALPASTAKTTIPIAKIRNRKKKILAILAAPAATPVNPRSPPQSRSKRK